MEFLVMLNDAASVLAKAISVVYSDTKTVLTANGSTIFGLSGIVIGALLTHVTGKRAKTYEYELQLKNKLLDRQITAHENVLKLAIDMRVMTGSGELDKNGEVIRFPKILSSKEEFEDWFTHFTNLHLQGTTWLSTNSKREVNFIQDYLVNLMRILMGIKSENYPDIGIIIHSDFTILSNALEKNAYAFFEADLSKSQLSSLDDWHKYERNLTVSRLGETHLLKNESMIRRLAST